MSRVKDMFGVEVESPVEWQTMGGVRSVLILVPTMDGALVAATKSKARD